MIGLIHDDCDDDGDGTNEAGDVGHNGPEEDVNDGSIVPDDCDDDGMSDDCDDDGTKRSP